MPFRSTKLTVHNQSDKREPSELVALVPLATPQLRHLLDTLPGCCPDCHGISVAAVGAWTVAKVDADAESAP